MKKKIRRQKVKEAGGYRGMTVDLKIQSIQQPKLYYTDYALFKCIDIFRTILQHVCTVLIMECYAL